MKAGNFPDVKTLLFNLQQEKSNDITHVGLWVLFRNMILKSEAKHYQSTKNIIAWIKRVCPTIDCFENDHYRNFF